MAVGTVPGWFMASLAFWQKLSPGEQQGILVTVLVLLCSVAVRKLRAL